VFLQVKLSIYTFESCCAAILRKRTPCIPHTQLAAWFAGGPGRGRWRTLHYLKQRAVLTLLMSDSLDLVGKLGLSSGSSQVNGNFIYSKD
jgi:DNA polymerase zeta